MSMRYYVTRLWIKYDGRIYRAGELLPEKFNHHDRFRNIFPSRIGLVELTETSKVDPAPLSGQGSISLEKETTLAQQLEKETLTQAKEALAKRMEAIPYAIATKYFNFPDGENTSIEVAQAAIELAEKEAAATAEAAAKAPEEKEAEDKEKEEMASQEIIPEVITPPTPVVLPSKVLPAIAKPATQAKPITGGKATNTGTMK